MSITVVFWMLLTLFAIVGGFRGWAKEILVLFSMVLALFLTYVLKAYVPGVEPALATMEGGTRFVLLGMIVLMMAFFGYQTPNIPLAILSGKLARERLQDWLLGSVIGLVNGYLIVGSLWWYMHEAGYPWPDLISRPPDTVIVSMVPYLPPQVLGPPYIFFAIGAAFVFVIVVFL
ncbi:MAG: CvpA family protein [Anaerolineales bacterium]